jgi:mannose-1-phosphate guanylyltransferase / mannose-6-phosphate isomerase
LTDQRSLLQTTVQRLQQLDAAASPVIVTSSDQRFLVAEQLRQVGSPVSAIVLEPVSRNTAPATAVAAIIAMRDDPEAVLLVLPADHAIANEKAFARAVMQGKNVAIGNRLVSFGIEPTKAHSGYGYIQAGDRLSSHGYAAAVEAFIEKPEIETARLFVEAGNYLWNSGIFMFRAAQYLEELKRYEPGVLEHAYRAVEEANRDHDFLWLGEAAFKASPDISIDHAVMERTSNAAVIASNDFQWNDIGSWSALAEIADADSQGNAMMGDVLSESVSNSLIRAEHRLVAAIGVDNLVIVETQDAVLVAHRDSTQEVKKIVDRLKADGRSETIVHRRVPRPWGSFERIDSGDRFQVKRIVVEPGARLSLQKHHHRAEHWIVVKGTALVTNGENQMVLTENQSTYIPVGVTHRLSNPGRIPLELIEVQSGSYLGEDDIVRMDDAYGRSLES